MSTSVDERVVSMKFDNKSFEQNAEISMKTLDTLKQKLDFSGIKQSLGDIDTSVLKKAFENIGNIDTDTLNSAIEKIEYRMSTLGVFMGRVVEDIADSLVNIVKNVINQIDKVISFAEEGIVTGGYNRAYNIQTAKFQLEGLGIAWEEISDDINFAVKDTAYSLDQAAIVASRLSTSGIRPGETWTDYAGNIRDEDTMAMILRSISGTASATGGRADYAQIGNILTKMISYGKVNLQQLNELGTFGIGAKGVIAEYMNKIGYQGRTNWAESDISEITASRTEDLDPLLVIEALYDKFGEHAVKANETLTGVIANTKSALARIGANFWEPLIENNGALVGIIEVVRQSLNDLNQAIGPVVNAFAYDLAGVLDKIKGLFMGKEYVYDEEGNLVYDDNGNPMTKWSLKTKGGIFSSFFEPWTKEKIWVDDSDKLPIDLPEGAVVGHWEEAESRIVRIANNIRDTLNNLISVGQTVFSTIGAAIKEVFPNAEGLAGLLVKITEWMKNVSEAWKNSSIFDSEHGWEKSTFYHIVRGIAAAVDIVIQFGKAFKSHVIDPIFNNSPSLNGSAIADTIAGIADAIWEFDQRLKDGEDVFGPFLDKVKDGIIWLKDALIQLKDWIMEFVDWVSPYLKDFFGNIIDWWKPVKDILFDTDISWSDKWGAIKDYFAENFELPGWSKVKDIFEGIGNAIGFAIDKIKDLFGWNEKSDTLTTDAAGSAYTKGGIASMSSVGGLGKMDLLKTIDTIDVSSEKLPTIGDRLKSFGSALAEVFGNFNPGQFKTAAYAVLGALAVLVLGVIYLMYKGYQGLKNVGTAFPILFGGVIRELQKTVGAMGKMFKAHAFASYAEGFKNLAAAIAILSLTILAIGALIAIMETVGDKDKITEGLWSAFGIVTTMTVIFGAISLVFVKLSQNASSMGLSISKAGLDLQMPINSLGSLRGVLVTLIGGIVVITGLIIVLGLLMSNEKSKNVVQDGAKVFLQILVGLAGSLLVMMGILKVFSLGKISGPAFATALAGAAGILAALGTALMTIVGSIIVLGLIPMSVLKRGGAVVGMIFVALSLLIGGIMLFAGFSAKAGKGNLKATTVSATLLGLAAVIFAVALAVDGIVISMILLDKLDVDMKKGALSLLAIGVGIVLISVSLMAVVSKLQNMKSGRGFNAKTLLGIAAMIASIGAAFVLISISARILDKVSWKGLVGTFGGFLLFATGMALIISQMKKMKEGELKNAGKLIAVIAATVVTFTVLGAVLSQFVNKTMAISYGIILGTMLSLLGFVWAIATMATKYKSLTPKQIEKFGTLIYESSMAMLPIMGGVAAFMLIAGLYSIPPGTIAAVALTFFAAVTAFIWLLEKLGEVNKKITTEKQVDRLSQLLFSASASLAILSAGLTAMFIGVGATGLGAIDTVGVALAFGISVFAMAKLINSVVTTAGGIKASEIKNAINLLIVGTSMMAILGVTMAAMFVAVGAAGLSGLDAVGIGIGFGIAVLAVSYAMTLLITKFQNISVSWQMVAAIALAIVGIVAPIIVIAFAIAKLVNSVQQSGISTTKLLATVGLLLAMVGVPAALIILAGHFKGFDKNDLIQMGVYAGILVGVALALGLVANALAKLAKQDSGQISRAALVLSLMAGVMAVITVVLTKVKSMGDLKQVATRIGAFAAVCATLLIVGLALKQVAAIEFKNMKESLIAMGVVVGIALALAIILGSFKSVGEGALKAGALLLGMGVMLAGLGVFMVLFAEGMNAFMDMILELNGKSDQISGGLTDFLTGFAEGLLNSFKKFNELLPQFLEELGKFIDGMFSWVNENLGKWFKDIKETIKISLIGISDIVNDPEVQNAAVGIVSGILDLLIKGADTWIPKILELAGVIAENLWKGIFGTPIPKDWSEVTGWLINLGEAIDDFFGGVPSHIIEVGIDLIFGGPAQDLLDTAIPKIESHYSEELKQAWLALGYTTEQWERLKNELPSFYEGMVGVFTKAELGDTDLQAWIEKQGGAVATMGNMVRTAAGKLGALPNASLTDIFDNSDPMAQNDWATKTMSNLNYLTSFVSDEWQPQMQDVMYKVGAALSGAFSEGDSGRMYEEAKATLWSIYEGTDDPVIKSQIYKMYRDLCAKTISEYNIAGGGNGRGSRMTKFYFLGVQSILDFCTGLVDVSGSRALLLITSGINLLDGQIRNSLGFVVNTMGDYGNQGHFKFEENLTQPVNGTVEANVEVNTTPEYTVNRNGTRVGPNKFADPGEVVAIMVAPFMDPQYIETDLFLEFNIASSLTTGASEGILQGATLGLRDTINDYILDKFDYGSGKAYYFVPIGEYVTAGLAAGITNQTAKEYVSKAAAGAAKMFINALESPYAFYVRSPSHNKEIREVGMYTTAGLALGAVEGGEKYLHESAVEIADNFLEALVAPDAFDEHSETHREDYRDIGANAVGGIAIGAVEGGEPRLNNAATDVANSFGSSLTNAFDNVDLSDIGNTLKSNISSKVPSWDSIKSNFGWEKGLSGNLQGVKNVWSQLSDAFTGGGSGFDIESLLGGNLSEKLTGGLSSLFSGFDMNSLGMDFDLASMVSVGADSIIDESQFTDWQKEFTMFDETNLDNTVELKVEVNDTDWNAWKASNTGALVESIPTMGGFQKSTVGSTYVNNYNYNQTNNSPTALSTREINRQTELLINRNRSRWAK